MLDVGPHVETFAHEVALGVMAGEADRVILELLPKDSDWEKRFAGLYLLRTATQVAEKTPSFRVAFFIGEERDF